MAYLLHHTSPSTPYLTYLYFTIPGVPATRSLLNRTSCICYTIEVFYARIWAKHVMKKAANEVQNSPLLKHVNFWNVTGWQVVVESCQSPSQSGLFTCLAKCQVRFVKTSTRVLVKTTWYQSTRTANWSAANGLTRSRPTGATPYHTWVFNSWFLTTVHTTIYHHIVVDWVRPWTQPLCVDYRMMQSIIISRLHCIAKILHPPAIHSNP